MGKSSAPKPPDPQQTAAAQTGANIGTAISGTVLGQVGQVTPGGTLEYAQTGTYSYTDPYTGQTYQIPQFTATTTLSPEQQAIYENLQTAATGLSGTLGTPFELGGGETEARLYELGRERLDPQFQEQRARLDQQLANQGVLPGSAAYETAIRQQRQAETDAYNQLLLTGRSQAVSEQIAERTLPLSELTTAFTGQQVTVPQFNIAQPQAIPTTDIAGITSQAYNQQLAAYQQQQQQQANILGGLFGLGTSLLGAYSDMNLKKNIKRIGTLDNGLPVYVFDYVWGGPAQIGIMAQDVEQVKPEAVGMRDGYKTVDYRQAVE